MAISQDEFMAKTDAELCGDRLILGQGPKRRYVGSIEEGVFALNDAGKEVAAVIESGGDIAAAVAGDPQPEADAAPAKAKRTATPKASDVQVA